MINLSKCKMKINEIFYSIQGEGKNSGIPTIFIRTTGCNLRCSYCDTTYAYENGKEKKPKAILIEIEKYNCKNISITGGEPLLQKDLKDLLKILIKKDYSITVETNGSLDISDLINYSNVIISLDIKCPSSSMSGKMIFKNISYLKEKDQLKMIIKNITDYEYAKKIIKKYKIKCPIFLQPVWGTNLKNLANWILDDNLNVILGLQLHKIIWGEKKGF